MYLRTHSKLNLFLRIAGSRGDGYHEIETILHSVTLADELKIEPAAQGLEVHMRMLDGHGGMPKPEDNLVARAARALLDNHPTDGGMRAEIGKRIPIGAGLGGGSANAAGALIALRELWDIDVSDDELHRIAATLGSDIAFCLTGGTALATGKGDDITHLPAPDGICFVLGITHEPLMTSEVYAHFDRLGVQTQVRSAPMTMALGGSDVAEIALLLHNDLELPAFDMRPELAKKKEIMMRAGALGALMSGSGPTIFGVAESEEHARTVAARLEPSFDDVMVVRSHPVSVERVS